jgi:ribosomal protein S18 acetylase RimI-like enzyme
VWYSLTRLPGYDLSLDIIAVAPDGSGASACTCWYDRETRSGEFEPVGTNRAMQRLGLGKAVIAEGLRRLREHGATQAIVQTNPTNTPAIALYTASGFQHVVTQYWWTKRLTR